MSIGVDPLEPAADAVKAAIEQWKSWRNGYLHYGDLISLRSCDGSLLAVVEDDEERGGDIMGGRRTVGPHSIFRIVDPKHPHRTKKGKTIRSGTRFGLRNLACSNFVGADFEEQATLTCYAQGVREWETFRVEPVAGSGGTLGLQYGTEVTLSVFSRYRPGERWWFLQYRRDTSRKVRANASEARAWETFVLVDPSEPH